MRSSRPFPQREQGATGSRFLHRVVARLADGLADGQAPVDAEHVRLQGGSQRQQGGAVVGEVDDRDVGHGPQVGDDGPHPGQGEAFVVARRQHPGPAVEQLQGLGPGTRLGLQVGAGAGGDLGEQPVVQLRFLEHHPLGVEEDLGAAALDQVGGQGERRAGKADERHLQFPPEQADGLEHKGQLRLRVRHAQCVHGRTVAHRVGEHRAAAFVEFEVEPHGLHGDEDVGEEDGRVEAEQVDGLQGDLGAQLRPLAQFEEADPAAHPLVFGQVAAGLAHEPDRGVGGLFAAAGLEKGVVHHGLRGGGLAAEG